MFKKFLVPLDRSALAESALAYARTLMTLPGCEVRLLLVHQPIPYAGFSDVPWYGEQASGELAYLQTIADELDRAHIKSSVVIRKGDPTEMICREARDADVDLVVMSSHGRSGLSRLWIGSVAEGVIKHSTVPVLVVRASSSTIAAEESAKTTILVPLDGSEVSDEIIPHAVSLARIMSSRLTLLQVVQPVQWIAPVTNIPYSYSPAIYDEELTGNLVSAARLRLSSIARRLETGKISVDTRVAVDDHVAKCIVDIAQHDEVRGIAMSTHGKGLSRLFLGSVADKVLRSATVPVLVHRPLALRKDRAFGDSTDKTDEHAE